MQDRLPGLGHNESTNTYRKPKAHRNNQSAPNKSTAYHAVQTS